MGNAIPQSGKLNSPQLMIDAHRRSELVRRSNHTFILPRLILSGWMTDSAIELVDALYFTAVSKENFFVQEASQVEKRCPFLQ